MWLRDCNMQLLPAQNAFPLGTGTALSAFVSTMNTVNTAFLTNTSAFVSAPSGTGPNQQGAGTWGRTVAGTSDTKTASTGTIDISRIPAPIPGVPVVTGQQTCSTTTKKDYIGYQFGHDISILNGGGTGANFHIGATAGYFEAKTRDTTPGGS